MLCVTSEGKKERSVKGETEEERNGQKKSIP